jgi:hypothetical protein
MLLFTRSHTRGLLALGLGAISALLAGCGDEFSNVPPEEPPAPLDVAGSYTIAVTNSSNGCGFANWEQGATTQNLPFDVQQDGDDVSGTIGGAAGSLVTLWLGSATFQGKVEESHVTMTIFGTTSAVQAGCAYTINATAKGDSSGDLLEGSIHYVPRPTAAPTAACSTTARPSRTSTARGRLPDVYRGASLAPSRDREAKLNGSGRGRRRSRPPSPSTEGARRT